MREFQIEPDTNNIAALVRSTRSEFIAVVTEPASKLHFWDGHTGKLLSSHAAPQHLLRLFFSPDNKVLAAIDRDGDVHLVERATGAIRRVATGDSGRQPFTRIAFSPDSGRLATVAFGLGRAGAPDPVLIWEIATGRHLASFPGRAEAVGSLVFTPDGRSLLISSRASVRRWRLAPANTDKDAAAEWSSRRSMGPGLLAGRPHYRHGQ